jgi:hypothetical protein
MRMLLKASIPVEAGNRHIVDGSMGKVMQGVIETLKPEATYFGLEDGQRTAYFFFDMKESSQMPAAGEALFIRLNANVVVSPVMTPDELKAGLEKLPKS